MIQWLLAQMGFIRRQSFCVRYLAAIDAERLIKYELYFRKYDDIFMSPTIAQNQGSVGKWSVLHMRQGDEFVVNRNS